MRIPLRERGVIFSWFWGFCYVFMVLGGVDVGHEIFFFFFFQNQKGEGMMVEARFRFLQTNGAGQGVRELVGWLGWLVGCTYGCTDTNYMYPKKSENNNVSRT
jgi:hypothetical protein